MTLVQAEPALLNTACYVGLCSRNSSTRAGWVPQGWRWASRGEHVLPCSGRLGRIANLRSHKPQTARDCQQPVQPKPEGCSPRPPWHARAAAEPSLMAPQIAARAEDTLSAVAARVVVGAGVQASRSSTPIR